MPTAPSAPDAAAITSARDKLRSPCMGILEAGLQALPLLIAIRYFNAPESIKAGIASAVHVGSLLTPFTLFVAAKLQARPAQAAAGMFLITALCIAGATAVESMLLFTACILASQVAKAQQGPLMLQVYASNYPATERGRRLATPLMLTAFSSMSFAWLGGEWLDLGIDNYRYCFALMVLAALLCTWALGRFPASHCRRATSATPGRISA